MSFLVLMGLLLAAVGTVVVAVAGNVTRNGPERGRAALAAILGSSLLLVLAGSLAGGAPASLPLPLGPPTASVILEIDAVGFAVAIPLLASALLAVLLADARSLDRVAVLAGSGLLLVLAADVVSLLAAAAAVAVAAFGLTVEPAIVVFALAGALAPLVPGGGFAGGDGFATVRAFGASGAAGTVASGLAVVAALTLLFRPPRRVPPGAEAIVAVAGVLLLLRVGFDLLGPAPNLLVALSVLAAGFAASLLGGRAALLAPTLGAFRRGAFVALDGVVVTFVAIALLARLADLAPVAAFLLGATLSLLLASAVASPLLASGSAAIARNAGSERLGALGGLATAMPVTVATTLASLAVTGFVPPFAGFASLWSVFDVLLTPQRFGGIALPVILLGASLVLAAIAGLLLVASFRLAVVAFAGRPRTPRGAAAIDGQGPGRGVRAAAAAVLLGLGVFPGPLLRLFAPVLDALAPGSAGAGFAGPFAVGAPGNASWSPPAVALLGAGAVAVPLLAFRRARPPAARPADAGPTPWDGGAAPPWDWLPFGEPSAQVSGPSLARAALASADDGAFPPLAGEGPRWNRRAAAPPRVVRLAAVATRRSSDAVRRFSLRAAPAFADGAAPLLAAIALAALLGVALARP